MSEEMAGNPCGAGRPGHRTLHTHFLRGERDRPETKIRTVAAQLAGRAPRRPGDGATGVGGVGWIDRERHQYRSMERATGLPEALPSGRALVAHTYEGPSPISGHLRSCLRTRSSRPGHPTAWPALARGRPAGRDAELRCRACDVHRPRGRLWTKGRSLWRTVTCPVEDTPEPEVCREKGRKTLVGLGFRPVELSLRASSGRSGIGRRRRSTRWSPSLLGGRCGGQVMGPPGSEESAGSIGSITSTDRW